VEEVDTSVSSDTVKSGRGFPGELSGSSKRWVNVGAATLVPGEEDVTLAGEVSSPIAVDTKFFSPGDIPLGVAEPKEKSNKLAIKKIMV
jgi:hypothetical protein